MINAGSQNFHWPTTVTRIPECNLIQVETIDELPGKSALSLHVAVLKGERPLLPESSTARHVRCKLLQDDQWTSRIA